MPSVKAPRRRTRRAPPPTPPAPPARAIGKYERLYRERHARDLALSQRPEGHPRGLWFDPTAGERVVQFIEGYCRHSKGELAGKPLLLSDWDRELVTILFGWKRADGTRRFRVAYIEVARKNSKSTTAAAIGLYLTLADHEPGSDVYASATKRDQAKIVHDAATAMVKLSPRLRKHLRTFRNNIHCPRTGSKFEPLGADSDTLDGLNPHGNIVDETHAHKDRSVWDVLQTAQGSRRQPLTLAITTAGTYDPESIGWELHEHACQVLDGLVEDDRFFAFIAAADEKDDWKSPRTWQKANPNLGRSVKLDYMREQCQAAEQTPSFLNTFLRLHLNIWTEQVTRWIPIEKWDACTGAPQPLEGRVVFGGLDLSTKLDITALTLVSQAADGCYDCLFRFWVPADLVAERERKHKMPSYAPWVEGGWLTTTPGNVIDYAFIRKEILALAGRMTIKQLGFDPWNASQLAVQLQQDLNPTASEYGFLMVEMRQNMHMLSEPSKEFEKLITARTLRHGGHPVMRWMVGNASVRRDANDNIAPDKSESKAKIDGVVSTIQAIGRATLQPAVGSGLGVEIF